MLFPSEEVIISQLQGFSESQLFDELNNLRAEVEALRQENALLRNQFNYCLAQPQQEPFNQLSDNVSEISEGSGVEEQPILMLSPVGLWYTDAQGNCIYANGKTLEITGLSAEEILREGCYKSWHPDDREAMVTVWMDFVAQSHQNLKAEYYFEGRILHSDGTILWALSQGVPQRSRTTGEIIGFVGTLTEITKQKTIEKWLFQAQNRHRTILNAIPDLILRVSRDGSCLDSIRPRGPSAGSFLPVTIKHHIREVLPPDLLQRQLQVIESVLGTGQGQSYRQQLLWQDRVFHEEVRIVPNGDHEVLLLIRDISQQVQAETCLDRFFDLSPNMLCIADFKGYFKRVNPAWERNLGYSQSELTSSPYIDLIHPEDRARTLAEAARLTEGVHTVEFENRYRCRDGTYHWFRWNATPSIEEGLIYCVVDDITERQQIEADLRQSQERIRLITDSIPGGIAYVGADRRYQFVNQIYEQWLHCKRKDIIGRYLWEVLGEAAYQAIREDIDRVLAGEAVELEVELSLKTGVNRFIYAQLLPDQTDQGVRGYYVLITDVSPLKRAEREIQQQSERLRSILNHMPIMVEFYDTSGQLLWGNAYLEKTLGWTIQEMQQMDVRAACYPDSAEYKSAIQHILAADCSWKDFSTRIRDGRIIDTSWINIRLDDGSCIGIGQDITERKQREASLRLALDNYHSIFENALTGIYQATLDGQYLRVNLAMAKIFGFASPQAMLQSVHSIRDQFYCTDQDWEQFVCPLSQQDQDKIFQYQVNRWDGKRIWVEEKTRVVCDSQGHVLYYEGFVEDICDRKRAEESLKKQVQRLQIQIDQHQKRLEVDQIAQTEYFQEIRAQIDNLRIEAEE